MGNNFTFNLTTVRSWLLIIWAVSFPFWVLSSSVLVALAFVLSIIDIIIERKFKFNWKQNLPVVIFFILIIISLLYSSDLERGLGDVKKKLPLLLVPFAFCGVNISFGMDIKRGLIASVLVYCLYNLIYCLFIFSQSDAVQFVPYFQTYMLNIWHPSYLTLYLLIGMVFAILDIMRGAKNRRFIIDAFTLVILGGYITFFTARAAKICALVLVFVVLSYLLFKRLPRNYIIIILSIISILLVIGLKMGYIQNKVQSTYSSELKVDGLRLQVWPAAIQLIKENPIIGVGAGDVRDEIKKVFENKGNKQLSTGQLNTHNQFLEVFVTLGAIGMSVFLWILFAPLLYLKNKLEYSLFLIICLVMFCFEATLNRQAGMIFFAFFYYLILWDDEGVEHRELFDQRMSRWFLDYVFVNISVLLTVVTSLFLLPANSSWILYIPIFILFFVAQKLLFPKIYHSLVVDNR